MENRLTDRDLADRVVSDGDEAAFEVLYHRHTPTLYRFALRLTGGDATEAEDILQDSWLKAARSLDRCEWRSAFRTWLMGIVFNRFRELARRNGRRVPTVGWEAEWPAAQPEPAGRIDLEQAIALLPPGLRAVLVLHDVEGFTHREIAEQLGVTDGTSKSQLHDARMAMRRLLGTRTETA
jgi:RNA polymerase sigma-70 factor (ECF subfamily)